MPYGKVQVTKTKGTYTVHVYAGDNTVYRHDYCTRANAYGDASFFRNMIKRGNHPGAVVQHHGFILTQM